VGFTYYEDVESGSEEDEDDDEGVIRVSYVQHAEVVAQLQQATTAPGGAPGRSANLQEQLSRLPNRMVAAFGRMSANLNCYQKTVSTPEHRSS